MKHRLTVQILTAWLIGAVRRGEDSVGRSENTGGVSKLPTPEDAANVRLFGIRILSLLEVGGREVCPFFFS